MGETPSDYQKTPSEHLSDQRRVPNSKPYCAKESKKQGTARRPALPWYRWFASDWRSSETRCSMDAAERGVYREALDLCYLEGSIPADEATLMRLLAVTPEEFARTWPKVSAKFAPHPDLLDRLVNPRAAAEIIATEDFRQKQAKNGRSGGRPRKNPTISQPKANGNPGLFSGTTQTKPKQKPPSHSSSKEELAARSQANGAGCESASPKKPTRNGYPTWYEAFWQEYPGARGGDAGGKKTGYTQALKFLATDEQRAQAVQVLRSELKRRKAKEAAGEFVPRLPYVERWFRKGYHTTAVECMASVSVPLRSAEPAPIKMAWEG